MFKVSFHVSSIKKFLKTWPLYLHKFNGKIFVLRNLHLKDQESLEEPNYGKKYAKKWITINMWAQQNIIYKWVQVGSDLRDILPFSGICILTVWLLPSRQ